MLIRTNYVSSSPSPLPTAIHPPILLAIPLFPLSSYVSSALWFNLANYDVYNVNLQKCMIFGKCCPVVCRDTFFFLILIENSYFQKKKANSSLFDISLLQFNLEICLQLIEVYKKNCLYPISTSKTIEYNDTVKYNFSEVTNSILFSISLEK